MKLEALSVPMDAVRESVSVGTVDVLEAFRAENPDATPDEAQREATRDRLLGDLAVRKIREIASQLRGELESARRGVATDVAGRLVNVEDGYDAPSLEALAALVKDAHGVRPTILRRTDDFLSLDEASTLEGLAFSGLPDLGLRFGDLLRELPPLKPRPVPVATPEPVEADGDAASYLEVPAEELPADAEPEDISPVTVQVGVAMPLLTDLLDGSLQLVRVTAADPAHEPESVDAVRDEVAADAALVAAYERLLSQKESILSSAVSGGLEGVEGASTPVEAPPFPRRTRRGSPDGRPVAPSLPEAGRAPALVDAAFAVVERLGPDQSADALTDEQRFVAAGVDGRLVLGLLRIDSLERPTRSELGRDVRSGVLTGLDQVLLAGGDRDPVSAEALRERMKYVEDR